MSAIKKSFKYGDHTVTIETGELARQADGAVLVTISDTVVLVTAVGLKKATPGRALSATNASAAVFERTAGAWNKIFMVLSRFGAD